MDTYGKAWEELRTRLRDMLTNEQRAHKDVPGLYPTKQALFCRDILNLMLGLQPMKETGKQDCYTCKYSEVEVDFDNQYAGTTDCHGAYVNSDSTCYTGNYKNKFEDDTCDRQFD